MPLFTVTGWTLIALNVGLIAFSHIALAKLSLVLPERFFENDRWYYQTFKWEDGGKIYERVFFIKHWKKYLPDGAKLFKDTFKKKSLEAHTVAYYDTFILETRRAEFSHLIQMLPAFVFYLFNPLGAALFITLYFVFANLIPIITQRYVRPKLKRLRERTAKKEPALKKRSSQN